MPKVYLSSTRLDLQAERQAVTDWLVDAGHQPVHSYVADSETVRDSCLADIAGCDLYVLILAHRYGFEPPQDNPDKLSITHLEFRRAGELGLPRVALLRTSVPDLRLTDLNDPLRSARVREFHAEVGSALRPAEFANAAELIAALSTGVQRALAKSQAEPAAGRDSSSTVRTGAPPSAAATPSPSPPGGWWSSLPGLLTAAAAVITAIAGLAAVFVGAKKPDEPQGARDQPGQAQAAPSTPRSGPTASPPLSGKQQSVGIGNVGAGTRINIQQRQ